MLEGSKPVLNVALEIFLIVLFLGQSSLVIADDSSSPDSPSSRQIASGNQEARARGRSISQLERRLKEVDQQLETLPRVGLRGGVGTIGARTVGGESLRSEWFEVELEQSFPIDHIVLVPMIGRDPVTGPQADGFPIDFRVVIGVEGDSEGTVIASFTAADAVLPRLAPLVLSCDSRVASWVRIEASRLSPRMRDSKFALQLAEIMVFSGKENVALHQNVTMSSENPGYGRARDKRFLVDGGVPYLLDARQGERSVAFVKNFRPKAYAEQFGSEACPTLTIDLGTSYPLDRVHIHSVEVSDTVPQTRMNSYGMPRHILLEGANQEDFSDAVPLFELKTDSVYELGPIVMGRFAETECRFVRFKILEPHQIPFGNGSSIVFGFAELQLFADSKNVALGKTVKANFRHRFKRRPLSTLTDGRNFYGNILPTLTWLEQLALRHDLARERPDLVAELNSSYGRQSSRLAWVTWLSLLLAVGIGAAILIGRTLRKRQLAGLRKRFAADLHDELGANIHVIGMLGDLAQKASHSPEKLDELLRQIRTMTERSGHALQHCTNMLDADEEYRNLLEDMQRTTKRVMADIKGVFLFDGDREVLEGLKPRTQADLFLFYKECLVNISRHSGATEFSAKLSATSENVSLVVNDNGQGQASMASSNVPPSLFRRAQLLGGLRLSKSCWSKTIPSIAKSFSFPWRTKRGSN